MYNVALHQERQSIIEDVYNGRIPKRVRILSRVNYKRII